MNAKTLTHDWAHQTKPQGKASALSYEGPVIRSYSTAIGRILAPGVYLVNTASFSVTTSGKHQGPMRQAIPIDATVLYYGDGQRGTYLDPSGAEVVAWNVLQSEIAEQAAKKSKNRKARLYHSAWQHLHNARAAALHYKIRFAYSARMTKLEALSTDSMIAAESEADSIASDARRAKLSATQRAKREAWEAGRAEREAKQAVENAERLAQWMEGKAVHAPYMGHAHFRVIGDPASTLGAQVESTQGAIVPLADFTRALRFALARRGKEWRANGETCPVGNYSLSAIDTGGVIAGCHRVTWSEIDRLAAVLL